ncbi:fibronectin type III domain-containing protein [Thiocapsa marina]|uniref:Fibronectin type III domain protein n=1 Tax=Thiocapsa marina 5811 TaxID=768671 RepID=F9UAR8_9GAMM|nr:fibronectin type III domain-containing protein [Thiocapsa marina]EGV18536.1 Fibronectin type III domain protein [Thiocapsa marina 5811]
MKATPRARLSRLPIHRLPRQEPSMVGLAVLALMAVMPSAQGADPTITAESQEIVSEYSWGYNTGLKQHLGSYKNGRSVHLMSRRTRDNPVDSRPDLGSPDFAVWVDEHTGEALALEHPAGVLLEDGVNPGGNAVFTSNAAANEEGRIWSVFGARANELPFDLARSSELFDPSQSDVVLDNFETFERSTSPTLSVVDQTGLLTYRYLHSTRPDGAVLFQRYDLSSSTPQLVKQESIGRASFVQGRGDITIEQVWSRWDPRRGALAVTWHWFERFQENDQLIKLFGSNPFLYTDDLGETWSLADGSPATLPLTYATQDSTISPYDHLAAGETMGWLTRDVGFGPKGTPWMAAPVGEDGREMRFFVWNESRWDNRMLTPRLDLGDPMACGTVRDYVVCAYSEAATPGTLLVRVSLDEGLTWSEPVTVDSVGSAPDGSLQRINWVSYAQPADRYLDNSGRFFFSYYKTSDGGDGRNFKNNVRWVRLQVGPKADFSADQRVDESDKTAFETAFYSGDSLADFNDNGVVDGDDLAAFNAAWEEEREADLPTPPAAPSNLTATALSSTQIQLTWQDNSTDETLFRIKRATGRYPSPFERLADVGADVVTFVDNTVESGTFYRYRVIAINPAGRSASSNTARIMMP